MPAHESLRLHCKTLRLVTIPQVVEVEWTRYGGQW